MARYFLILIFLLLPLSLLARTSSIDSFKARPPIHFFGGAADRPEGMTPLDIKSAYHLPKTGGHGTIALIDAFDTPMMEHDLGVFDAAFSLPECTVKNKCFEIHKMASGIKNDSGWAGETALDVEWAHAIAPQAKILLVEAKTDSGTNLVGAIDYARSRSDVVAISMSWGGEEFSNEEKMDKHLVSKSGAAFFASSGDNGAGVSWPSASNKVIAVGGTTLSLKSDRSFLRESAWSGSGGGVSSFIKEPSYQAAYKIPRDKGMRGVPDVSYDADPATGFSVYLSDKASRGSWQVVGGTSAGAPQWAAIRSLGSGLSLENLYRDKSSANSKSFLRDVTSGNNGDCAYFCNARAHYDYVTGLGTPETSVF